MLVSLTAVNKVFAALHTLAPVSPLPAVRQCKNNASMCEKKSLLGVQFSL